MISFALKLMLLFVGITLSFFSMAHSDVVITGNGCVELYNPSNETATLNNCRVDYTDNNGSTFSTPVHLVDLEPYSSHVVKIDKNLQQNSAEVRLFCVDSNTDSFQFKFGEQIEANFQRMHGSSKVLSETAENETTDEKGNLPLSSIASFSPAESTSDPPLQFQEQDLQFSLEQNSELNQGENFDKLLAKASALRSMIKAFKDDTEIQREISVKKVLENELQIELLGLKVQDLKSRAHVVGKPPLQDHQQQQEPSLTNQVNMKEDPAKRKVAKANGLAKRITSVFGPAVKRARSAIGGRFVR